MMNIYTEFSAHMQGNKGKKDRRAHAVVITVQKQAKRTITLNE